MDDIKLGNSIQNAFPEHYRPDLDLNEYRKPVPADYSLEFMSIVDDLSANTGALVLPIILGVGEQSLIEDLYHFPNLLLAGTTGSGKTQFLYNQLALWLFSKHPSELKLIICGTKDLDYSLFADLERHYLAGIKGEREIISVDHFALTLEALQLELEKRISLFNLAGVKTILDYNQLFLAAKLHPKDGHRFLPSIVLLIDDLYNFIENDDQSNKLISLLQKTGYTGIYILAVTSQINAPALSKQLKSNFVYRIGMKLMSQSDSKKILNEWGAEKLKEAGSLLYWGNGKLVRAMQPYIDFRALRELIDFVGKQRGYPHKYELKHPNPPFEFDPMQRDPLFEDAARLIVIHHQGSVSLLQRKMKLGYNRCGRIIDQLEAAGIVGPFDGIRAREVLITDEYVLEHFLANIDNEHCGPISNTCTTPSEDIIAREIIAPDNKNDSSNIEANAPSKTNVFAAGPSQERLKGFWAKLKAKFK